MSVKSTEQPAPARPRLWWWLVAAAAGLYVVLLAGNYVMLWFAESALTRIVAEVVLVAFAAFAAAQDLAAARPHRPLRRIERVTLVIAALLVLAWLAGLALTSVMSEGRVTSFRLLIGLLIAIPVLPIAALAIPGTVVFHRARQPQAAPA